MIRELTMDDYNDVYRLIHQVHEIHLENRPDIYNEGNPCPMGFYERILNQNDFIKCAYIEDDKIIGVLLVEKQEKSLSILKQRSVYFIDDIVVDKNSRHKGIGKKLYKYLLDKAKENNIDSVELNVWAFNKDAIEFYKSLGMQEMRISFEQKLK